MPQLGDVHKVCHCFVGLEAVVPPFLTKNSQDITNPRYLAFDSLCFGYLPCKVRWSPAGFSLRCVSCCQSCCVGVSAACPPQALPPCDWVCTIVDECDGDVARDAALGFADDPVLSAPWRRLVRIEGVPTSATHTQIHAACSQFGRVVAVYRKAEVCQTRALVCVCHGCFGLVCI
jgi:hypothetical protein